MTVDDKYVGCPDCGVMPGSFHEDGCDVSRCAVTGQQRLFACDDGRGCAAAARSVDCRTVWDGEWPGVRECREWGWYAYLVPNVGYERCDADHPQAWPDLNRLSDDAVWMPGLQRYMRKADLAGDPEPSPLWE